MRLLIDKGSQLQDSKHSVLHKAIQYRGESVAPIELLLKAGADINWKSCEGTTVLDGVFGLEYKNDSLRLLKMISANGFDFSAHQHSVKNAL